MVMTATTTNFDYYNFRIDNLTTKINEEISFYEKYKYGGVYPVNEYVAYLKGRIGTDRVGQTLATYSDNLGNRHEVKKMDLSEHMKDMDIYTFSKPWKNLKEIHKMMKIKEFIDSLEYKKKYNHDEKSIIKNKERLKKKVCLGLKEKKFLKNKSDIEYDQEKMKIQSISCLYLDKKSGLYKIDWDC